MSASRAALLAAIVANDDVGETLEGPIVRAIGVGSNAVTSMTSLLALPSWRPEQLELHGSGMSCCGCSCRCGGTMGMGSRCGGVSATTDLEEEATLARLLAEDAATCGERRPPVVEIEFWDMEIVDVKAVRASNFSHPARATARTTGTTRARYRLMDMSSIFPSRCFGLADAPHSASPRERQARGVPATVGRRAHLG
jgi:hypothetical protein